MNQKVNEKVNEKVNDKEEKVLYDSAPSMIRNRPFLYIFSVGAAVVGSIGLIILLSSDREKIEPLWFFLYSMATIMGAVGIVTLFFWWLKVINTRLTVTNERVRLRAGILSKRILEVFLSDIRSVEINQGLMQRIFGTGCLDVASAGSAESEIKIDGIPNAYSVKAIIDEHRRRDRTEVVGKVTDD